MRKLLSVILAAGLLAAFATPTAAAPERIPIGGTESLVAVLDPGRAWTSDGIEHVRGWTAVYAVVGDELSTGTSTIVANWNINSSGDGTMWGYNSLRLDAYDGGWDQSWTAKWSGGTWVGQGVGHGFGEMTGSQTRLDVWATGLGTDAFSGFAFVPGS
jgi:hypothetical protein